MQQITAGSEAVLGRLKPPHECSKSPLPITVDARAGGYPWTFIFGRPEAHSVSGSLPSQGSPEGRMRINALLSPPLQTAPILLPISPR